MALDTNTGTSDNLPATLQLLHAAGATIQEHPGLYQALADNPYYADKLPALLTTLSNAGLTIKDHWKIYQVAIENAYYADKLPTVFAALQDAGATLEPAYLSLYEYCVIQIAYADDLLSFFTKLKAVGVTVQAHATLVQTLLASIRYIDHFVAAFSGLNASGATLENNYPLYEQISNETLYNNKLETAFAILREAGATFPECSSLYSKTIDIGADPIFLSQVVEKLETEGATLPRDLLLFQQMLTRVSCYMQDSDKKLFINKLSAAFSALKTAGATIHEHPFLYLTAIRKLEDALKLSIIFGTLQEAGITLQQAYQPLWIAAIKSASYSEQLPFLFSSLEEAGIPLQEEYVPVYALAIRRAPFTNVLPQLIKLLQDVGVILPDDLAFFMLVLEHIDHINILIHAFGKLKEAGATFNEHKLFFKLIIKNVMMSAESLGHVLHALNTAGATVQKYPLVYDTVFENAHDGNILSLLCIILKAHPPTVENYPEPTTYADNLSIIFSVLKSAGKTLEDHLPLYSRAIQYSQFADSLSEAFAVLHEVGASMEEHQPIYLAIIPQASYAQILSIAFTALGKVGLTFEKNQALYEAIIRNAQHTHTYLPVFAALEDTGVWPELEALIINQADNYLTDILHKLALLEFNALDDLDIIKPALISNNIDILLWLEEHGFKKSGHRFIFELIFTGDTPLIHSPYAMSKVKSQLHRYLEENTLLSSDNNAWTTQCADLKQIVDKIQKADNEITAGPLNKSDATKTTEAILKRISMENIENVNLRFDEQLGYILQFYNEPEIYLTELLKLTNFNHITLATDEIILLGNKIQDVAPDFNGVGMLNNSLIVDRLPVPARRALSCYVGHCYKNINRFLRGMPQTAETKFTWITPVEGRENLIATFLLGCLVSWSAATLPHLLHDSKERQLLKKLGLDGCDDQDAYKEQLKTKRTEGLITQDEYKLLKPLFLKLSTFFPNYGLLDRGDEFDIAEEEGELCPKKRFTANPGTFTPAILSLSVFPQGYELFHPPGSTATKIETDRSRPIINAQEGEILLPPGSTLRYTEDNTGTFFAREVNSPGIVPNGGYWSSIALAEAFRNHLSKAYADSSAQVSINNISIPRPNHGLAHSYRKMVYIDIVINYFAHHAVDPAFRLFCQTVSPEEREWLRVTAAYSVTGRESELSPHDNLDKYNQYKVAGKANMEAFLDKYPPANPDEAMRERMLDCVRWLGNPDYEQGATINAHPDSEEREHRNFIHRILCVAHNIDLPRCRESEQFEQDMAVCRRLSVESVEQRDDYTRMVDYAAQLIQAHGDSVGGYQSPFEKVSTNLRQLREVTESVTRPKVREPYQFTTPHPQPFSP